MQSSGLSLIRSVGRPCAPSTLQPCAGQILWIGEAKPEKSKNDIGQKPTTQEDGYDDANLRGPRQLGGGMHCTSTLTMIQAAVAPLEPAWFCRRAKTLPDASAVQGRAFRDGGMVGKGDSEVWSNLTSALWDCHYTRRPQDAAGEMRVMTKTILSKAMRYMAMIYTVASRRACKG